MRSKGRSRSNGRRNCHCRASAKVDGKLGHSSSPGANVATSHKTALKLRDLSQLPRVLSTLLTHFPTTQQEYLRLGQAISTTSADAMAPTDELGSLKSTIDSLQKRVEELEARLAGKASGGSNSDGMRMILMGPPGAGT